MFDSLCQISLWILLIQGILAPVFIVWCGFICVRHGRRLAALESKLNTMHGDGSKKGLRLVSLLERVPKLQPLNCRSCGGGLLLMEKETFCPHCGVRGELPPDYEAVSELKGRVHRIFRRALCYWRVAHLFTRPGAAWFFAILAVVELLLIVPAARAIHLPTFPTIELAFFRMGLEKITVFSSVGMFGLMLSLFALVILNTTSRKLHSLLSAQPALSQDAPSRESASCQNCGGQMIFERRAFVAICPYCNVVNFRPEFVRQEETGMRRQGFDVMLMLFNAMSILDEFLLRLFAMNFLLFVTALVWLRWSLSRWLH